VKSLEFLMKGLRVYRLVFAGMASLMLLQSFGHVLFIASFQLNRDYFATQLCVQRERPGNDCQGQCQLVKRFTVQTSLKEGSVPLRAAVWESLDATPPASFVAFGKRMQSQRCPQWGIWVYPPSHSLAEPPTRPPALG
jgi:hypothetical protein